MSAAPLFETSHNNWMLEGTCREVDPDLWHPEKGGNNGDGKRICRTCPVVDECLAYALADPDLEGIWGGASERERRDMRAAQATPQQQRQRSARARNMYKTRTSI